MENWVSEYLQIVKQRLGLSSDTELAQELGFGKSTFATWRRRGNIPEPALIRMSDQIGHDLFFTGDELVFAVSTSQAAMLVRALYTYIVIKRRPEIDMGDFAGDENGDLMWWAGMRFPIERMIRPLIVDKVRATLRPADAFKELCAAVDAGELASVEQLIQMWNDSIIE